MMEMPHPAGSGTFPCERMFTAMAKPITYYESVTTLGNGAKRAHLRHISRNDGGFIEDVEDVVQPAGQVLLDHLR